jgi:hypothetical protein
MRFSEVELVTKDDIFEELGIDLMNVLKITNTQVLNNWLRRIERLIYFHVAQYCYSGVAAVERMINSEYARSVMRDAVMEQINYLAANRMLDPSRIIGIEGKGGAISVADPNTIRAYTISPLAHEILLNGGLLYSGESA